MFLNNTTEQASSLIDGAVQSADQAIKSTQQMAHRGLESVRETTHQLRVKAEHASENTVNYIRHEPIKSVLIAAATGAALMALINLVSHRRH